MTPEAFTELEQHCANFPGDSEARSLLLRNFFALGQPEGLPGSSWPLRIAGRPPRVAVLTPYCRERLEVLERCHRSVRSQTIPCDHVVVADGFPRDELDAWPLRHLRLAAPCDDSGDTPRRIAGAAAVEAGYDAVLYLDADNWLRPRHVESLLACHLSRGSPVCHSARTLHRVDGSLMPLAQRRDNVDHVDTSCLFIARAAFDLLSLWGTWPRELSVIDDRILWRMVVTRNYGQSFTGAFTTCYEATHLGFYRSLGELPPPNVRPDIDLGRLFAWYAALTPAEAEALDRKCGVAIGALIGELRAMRR